MKERPILMTPENAQKCHDGTKTQTRRIVKPQPFHISWFEHQQGWCAKVRKDTGSAEHPAYVMVPCPYGVVGDRLWVREAFTYWEYEEPKKKAKSVRWEDLTPKQQANAIEQASHVGEDYLVYKGGGAKRSLGEWKFPHPIYEHCIGRFGKTIPSIHMPRWACRTVLDITGVRVERLQAISEEDAIAEGVTCLGGVNGTYDRDDFSGCWTNYSNTETAAYWNSPIDSYHSLWDSINGVGSWALNPWVWVIEFRRSQS